MGFFELIDKGPKTPEKLALTADQTECIRRHLAMVFKHEIDPSYPNGPELDQIHNPSPCTVTSFPNRPPTLRC